MMNGRTPATTTQYRCSPERTDGEFNGLKLLADSLWMRVQQLTEQVAGLQATNDRLTREEAVLRIIYAARGGSIAHMTTRIEELEAENNRLQDRLAYINRRAADDGPETVYDWSQDEDAVEFDPERYGQWS